MKLIKPEVKYYGEIPVDRESALAFIEVAGRTCYKSEDKITDESAEKFVGKLIKAGHLAMVEHSNFVVKVPWAANPEFFGIITQAGKFLNVVEGPTDCFVGGNLTAWFNTHKELSAMFAESGLVWDDSMFVPFFAVYSNLFGVEPFMKETRWEPCPQEEIPEELHRYSVKLICDRGVSHEVVRHRPCSFAQESTRYVNYAGRDIEFIEPTGYENWSDEAKDHFVAACEVSSIAYNSLRKKDMQPQQARAVLNNAVKTEVVVTADAKEWAHIKKLRTHKSAHPDMVHIMNMMPWRDIFG